MSVLFKEWDRRIGVRGARRIRLLFWATGAEGARTFDRQAKRRGEFEVEGSGHCTVVFVVCGYGIVSID